MNKKAITALAKLDPRFGAVISQIGPIRFEKKKTESPYEALIEAVIYQQLTAKAAGTIFERFKELFPGKNFPRPEKLLATPVETLRRAGLSQSKALAVHDIATQICNGAIPSLKEIHQMDDEEIIERLITIRGVGRWTVEMFLIFNLGRPDIFPITDYGIKKGFMKVFRKRKLPTPAELELHSEPWCPYRTTAALYLWRALREDQKGKNK